MKDAVRAVPAIKFALGIAGILSVIAIVKIWRLELNVAVYGTVIMLILMTALVVFARVYKGASTDLRTPALVLTWFSLVLVMSAGMMMFTSVFFRWPLDLRLWIDPRPVAAASDPKIEVISQKSITTVETDLRAGSALIADGFRDYARSGFCFKTATIEAWNSPVADILVANPDPKVPNALFFLPYNQYPYEDSASVKGARAGIIKMLATNLTEVTEAPESGYSVHWLRPELNAVYCVRTSDGQHYAKIQVTAIESDRIAFEWVYQQNATRNLAAN